MKKLIALPLAALAGLSRLWAVQIVPCFMALLVLSIGTVVVVKMVRFCKDRIPPSCPSPAQPTNNAPTNSVPKFAAWIVIPDSVTTNEAECADCSSTAFCFDYTVGFQSNAFTARMTGPRLPVSVSAEEFTNALVLEYGLTNAPYSTGYSSNGTQVGSVPIDFSDGRVLIDGGGVDSVIERSTNLLDWTPILTNSVPLDRTVQFTDSQGPAGAAFYRIRLP